MSEATGIGVSVLVTAIGGKVAVDCIVGGKTVLVILDVIGDSSRVGFDVKGNTVGAVEFRQADKMATTNIPTTNT